jgi:two-component system OmpR family response regulator
VVSAPKQFGVPVTLAEVRQVVFKGIRDPDYLLYLLEWTVQQLSPADSLSFAGWTVDITQRKVISPQRQYVELPATRFDLLLAFAQHNQRVLTRDRLISLVHGPAYVINDRTIDVQVSRLRYELGNPKLIRTVRGSGYLFVPDVHKGAV